MTIGSQFASQFSNRYSSVRPFRDLATGVDNLIFEVRHSDSILEREARHFFQRSEATGCLEDCVLQ